MPTENKILDTDLYKLTMQQAMFFNYGDVDTEYVFINRGGTKFTEDMVNEIKRQVDNLCNSYGITEDAYNWLLKNCPYLKRPYLHYLKHYRYSKEELEIYWENGDLQITAKGPSFSSMMWEVPILSIVSESYNRHKYSVRGNFFITNRTWLKKLKKKISYFNSNNIYFADFGTRRRFMYMLHDTIVETLADKAETFVGTSNVLLAYKHNIKPIGTHAHEWFMLHQGLFGTQSANTKALELWQKEYRGSLGIALTDTYTTEMFLKYFDSFYARLFDGVRHDSGDPIDFAEKIIAHYESLGIDPKSKTIIFSDGLNVEKIEKIRQVVDGRIKHSYGIGTNITNDVGDEFTPLNIVMKLSKVNGKDVVKLSDVPGKNTGNPEAVENTKYEVGQILKG